MTLRFSLRTASREYEALKIKIISLKYCTSLLNVNTFFWTARLNRRLAPFDHAPDMQRHAYVLFRACACVATRGRLAQPRLGCVLKLGATHFAESSLERGHRARPPPPPSVYSTTHETRRTMKLFWAVGALLLGCWRASASTGKNFASAILGKCVILVRLCPPHGQ